MLRLDRYRQIARTLTAEIAAGKYPAGSVFPRRAELAARFGVTRVTINRAVNILAEKGLILARRGSGTVVINTHPRYNIAYIAPHWCLRFLPVSNMCTFSCFDLDTFQSLSDLGKLAAFDGTLWSHPPEDRQTLIRKLQQSVPTVIVNRTFRNCNYVATDQKQPVRRETTRLLKQHPTAQLYFLEAAAGDPAAFRPRRVGFEDACRDTRRTGTILKMPPGFEGKLQLLEENLPHDGGIPLILIADVWRHTGAVVRWVSRHGLNWGTDVILRDFDNDQPEVVWGLTVTSFVQNFAALSRRGLDFLLQTIGNPDLKVREEIIPEFWEGDT